MQQPAPLRTQTDKDRSSGVLPMVFVTRCIQAARSNPAIVLLFLSGFCGFYVGMFGHATWQASVESAQVLSRVVTYPQQTPFYVYHKKLWALPNQVCAFFLYQGVSERTLSFIVSGLLGMFSFQALAFCVFAFCRNHLLALSAPFFIYLTHATNFGVVYPVSLIDDEATYGVLGLSFIFLTAALLGVGKYKPAGLLLGLAPAVHPSLGTWFWLIVLICFLWDFRQLRAPFTAAIKPILLGSGVTLVSFALHLFMSHGLPDLTSEAAGRHLAAFVRYWDPHRRPIDLFSPGVYLAAASVAISLCWLRLFHRDLPRNSLLVMRIFVVSGALAFGFSFISWLPPEMIPNGLLLVMPGRLFNLNNIGFMALMMGLLGYYGDDLWAQLTLASLLVGLWLFKLHYGQPRFVLTAMLGSALALLFLRWRSQARSGGSSPRGRFLVATKLVQATVLGLIMIQTSIQSAGAWPVTKSRLRDWTNDLLFAEASRGKGLLLTSSDMNLVQLRTRRPLLLDAGALNTLTLAPETGPEMNRILRNVYGIDLFNPPAEARRRRDARVPGAVNRETWESRTAEQWARIAKQFGITEVITYADWKLELPEVIHNQEFILYRMAE